MRASKLAVLFILAAAISLTFMAGGASLAARSNPVVKLQTSMGDIEIELYPDKAPKTVENFLNYVNKGFYNGTVFHRVINGFMVQGGGLNDKMQLKATDKPIQNEADNGLKNDEYTVAMARTMDPNSATAQFFINVTDNDFLNFKSKDAQGWGYAVFGKVIKGMDVVDKIKAVETTTKGMHQDVPVSPVVINKAEVVQE
jgi:peptidyl-prolyl cis-trans isomerase B (cyclophilin B)